MGMYEQGMDYAVQRLKAQIAHRWLEIVANHFTQKQVEIKYSDDVKRKLGIG